MESNVDDGYGFKNVALCNFNTSEVKTHQSDFRVHAEILDKYIVHSISSAEE